MTVNHFLISFLLPIPVAIFVTLFMHKFIFKDW